MADYYIAFWNLENLFDVEESPRRSEKLVRALGKELKGWTETVLKRKIQQLASIISQMNGGRGPDLLGVCEVENRYVLELLVAGLSGLGRSYGIAHADTADRRGIDVAFIYDRGLFKTKKKEQFSHFVMRRTATRDLFQVNFRTKSGKLLVVVGNHWPSRSGGRYESEAYRMIAGETLAYFHERIREVQKDNDAAVLAMGDFNDEPFDRAMVGYALSCRERGEVTRARSAKFLNLMWPLMGQGIATHYYGGTPNMLDQFLASKGLLTGKSGMQVRADSVDILRYPEMLSPKSVPSPIRFGRKSDKNLKLDGFSDHFPIAVQVREK